MLCHVIYLGPMFLFIPSAISVQFHLCSVPISIKPALSFPGPLCMLSWTWIEQKTRIALALEKFTVTRNEERQNCQKTGLLRLLEVNRQILSSKQALMVARVENKQTNKPGGQCEMRSLLNLIISRSLMTFGTVQWGLQTKFLVVKKIMIWTSKMALHYRLHFLPD